MGPASELEYQLLLAYDLDYQDALQHLIEIKKMLNGFIRKVRSDRQI